MTTKVFDIVVYGNTWAAVNAACGAAIEGSKQLTPLRVCLINNYAFLGGIIANGLSRIDYGRNGTKGVCWLTDEFFNRITRRLGVFNAQRRVTPSTAAQVLQSMLQSYGVYIEYSQTLASVQKTGAAITSLTMVGGDVFQALRFIDGSEEGDAAKMAGVTMHVGREAADSNSPLNGYAVKMSTFRPFDCYSSPGVLLPGFTDLPSTTVGAADGGVQSYGFRLCATQNKENQRRWTKPSGYNPALFEYRRRELDHLNGTWIPFRGGGTHHGKVDINSDYGNPYQLEWPDATPTRRAQIANLVYAEFAGYLWWLANDSSVHPNVKAYVNSWGPCLDEFPTTLFSAGWPKELYVRVGRKMVGQYKMTQADTQTNITKANAVAVGFYSLDNHIVGRYACVVGGVAGYVLDSFGTAVDTATLQVKPYQIPYTCLLPLASECNNLLSVCAVSADAVAISSMRIDMHKANAASAAGLCAAYSIMNSITLHAVDAVIASVIQPKLTAYGQVWSYTPPA